MSIDIHSTQTCDLLYLLGCALHGVTPDANRVVGMDLGALYQLSHMQSLTAMCYMGLAPALSTEQQKFPLIAKWRQDKDLSIRKNLLLDTARAEITARMEAAGIWYIPLKGVLLKSMYPAEGMRQMSDNDILHDPARRQDVQAIMLTLGFELAPGTVHDTYQKLPIYNFEMHRGLFTENQFPVMAQYYNAVLAHICSDEIAPCARALSDEDAYIYNTAHAFKHFSYGGTGLRFLIDCYVYLAAKGATMDRAYLDRELATLGLTEFEAMSRHLSAALFDAPVTPAILNALSEEDQKTLADCMQAGTYGNYDLYARNELHRMAGNQNGRITTATRLRYYWSRLWPSQELCQTRYPFFAKWRICKPFLMVFRLVRGLFKRGRFIKAEIKSVERTGRKN